MSGGLALDVLCPEHCHVVILCKFHAGGAESDHEEFVQLLTMLIQVENLQGVDLGKVLLNTAFLDGDRLAVGRGKITLPCTSPA